MGVCHPPSLAEGLSADYDDDRDRDDDDDDDDDKTEKREQVVGGRADRRLSVKSPAVGDTSSFFFCSALLLLCVASFAGRVSE